MVHRGSIVCLPSFPFRRSSSFSSAIFEIPAKHLQHFWPNLAELAPAQCSQVFPRAGRALRNAEPTRATVMSLQTPFSTIYSLFFSNLFISAELFVNIFCFVFLKKKNAVAGDGDLMERVVASRCLRSPSQDNGRAEAEDKPGLAASC